MSNAERKAYMDPSVPVKKRVEDLLARMTLEEKVAQLGSCWVYQLLDGKEFSEGKAKSIMRDGLGQITRIGGASNLDPTDCAKLANKIQKYLIEHTRLGIPAIVHEEACSGFMTKGATCFPQTIGVSCTWDPELVEEMAKVIKTQMRAAGAHQALAPLLDVTRDPRWGRTEETYGEDPYLVSKMGSSYVRGLQDKDLKQGIISTGKHFVGYGNSEGGMNWAPAHIPPRELREVFLAPFEAAVRDAGLGSVMNGYHELDGVPCSCSKELLTDILRDQWGFDGIVVSDYFAINMLYEYHNIAADRTAAAKMALEAGIDVELPNIQCYGDILKEAVVNGIVSEALVDKVVGRTLKMKFQLGLFENPYVDAEKTAEVFDTAEQRDLAYRIALKSMVLLKNENNLLPLKKDIKSIAVIGPNADTIRNIIGDYAYPCHIEALLQMTSDDNVMSIPVPGKLETDGNFVPMISILDGIRQTVSSGTVINYARGCGIIDTSREGFTEAVEAAKKSEVTVVFVGDKAGLIPGCSSGESKDMAELKLPGVQEELVRALYETGKPVVVVLVSARPYSINWINEKIPAILEAWLPGEEGAKALADVLFGSFNPGGKLSITFPCSSGQIPVFHYHKKSGGRSHWQGDYVDLSCKPLYPFGYGLSYTNFKYTDLKISTDKVSIGDLIGISVSVKNTGKVCGDEVVQLYTNQSAASVTRPVSELKGFRRITLDPGETKTVNFSLSPKQLGFYDLGMKYVVEPGSIKVMIGSSSADIRLQGEFEITGGKAEVGKDKVFFSHVTIK